ncbi:MBL fold metallo-hydrolase [Paracoccus salipaludis]|uniref:MBL fold metallo-hydrolase n=1 Tax=Paracoccus salipaludis TaxID=2032623 RepID=A0A2A2GEV8_9RHOB|nr:MBL fold metallo-hydrolase [Paracoccus salipaludis]PAU96166.1 MBL fold metallo-hydrolase [Paracoccus salipaludis]
MSGVGIHTLFSQWGRFGLYSFYIDGSEPAIVDTGIASSPSIGIAPGLRELGRRVEDLRWILLTHGHIDHVGGAHALWEMTGRKAKVVIHEADVPFLRSRRAHVEEYLEARGRYIRDTDGESKIAAACLAAISGEMEPHVVVRHGDELSLGPDVTVRVHSVPGHSAGSVAYEIVGQGDVFAGDSVQIHGAANGFPSYADPDAYRDSLLRLRDHVRPNRLFLGHPYRSQGAESEGVELDRDRAAAKIQESIDIEAKVRNATYKVGIDGPGVEERLHSPFCCIADYLKYDGDPTLEPSPFFTTMHGYFNKGYRS